MRRAEDGVGMGEAVWVYLYGTCVAKESRKYEGRVTQRARYAHRREGHVLRARGQTATAKDPHETKEGFP
jgi:hypothetical protein